MGRMDYLVCKVFSYFGGKDKENFLFLKILAKEMYERRAILVKMRQKQ